MSAQTITGDRTATDLKLEVVVIPTHPRRPATSFALGR
jgi:hypothetical protein